MVDKIIRINGRLCNRKPIIGLALSGGGLRGMAHIGVLQVLGENHIPIDMISGTSAGAIIAALHACGYNPRQMQAMAENLDLNKLIDLEITVKDLFKNGIQWLFGSKFRFWSVLPVGLLKGDKIEQYLAQLWQMRTMRDTLIPLAITAVDINSGDTVFFVSPQENRQAILNARYYHNVLISDAVRASISIPGIFFPKKNFNMTLVDGAVKNNLPTDILQCMGANVIIAVDLGYSGQPNYNIKTVGEILLQSIDIMGREVTLLKGEQYADIIIRPEVHEFPINNKKYITRCIDRGAQATWAAIDEIKRLAGAN